ncbi:VRR-NUC domain-containing protein [Candidatus Parcubacteria bacterium]|nr:VRR-NUC domain-containing protein [Candidatus Parcubacteria bacterium]
MQRKPTKKFWANYSSLYGHSTCLSEPKPKKPRRRDEELEQEKFNVWFDKVLKPLGYRWFHPANGGKRQGKFIKGKWVPTEGAKFKRLGVKSGVPDVILPVSRSPYHGLVIELKRVDGKRSDVREDQQEWLDWFTKAGWRTEVAYGFEEAKAITLEYLKNAK